MKMINKILCRFWCANPVIICPGFAHRNLGSGVQTLKFFECYFSRVSQRCDDIFRVCDAELRFGGAKPGKIISGFARWSLPLELKIIFCKRTVSYQTFLFVAALFEIECLGSGLRTATR